MNWSDNERHVDAFDHLRTQVVAWTLIRLVSGDAMPAHEIMRGIYEEWQATGDIIRRPEDMVDRDDALKECTYVLDLAVAMYSDAHFMDAERGCAAVAIGQAGPPAETRIGYCAPCCTTHVVPGLAPDPAYTGSLPMPTLHRPRADGPAAE